VPLLSKPPCLLAALGAVALLAGACGGRVAASAPTSAKPAVTTTSAPAPATATTTTLPPGATPYTWQVDQGAALDLGGGATTTLSSVIMPGASGDWLIAGTRSSGPGSTTATVWTSPDALHWARVALPKPSASTPTAARAAANWGDQLVVVGSEGTAPNLTAAVWISHGPGEPFVAVPANAAFAAPSSPPAGEASGGAVMTSVAGGALGLFAAGTIDGRATIWYSTGGQSWQVLAGAGAAINHYRDAEVNTVLSTHSGIFASGSYLDGDRLSGELWSSSDGIHWSNDGGWFAGAGDRVITSLVDMAQAGNAEPGLLALGGIRVGADWQPASWISPNGSSWSQASESFPLDDEPAGSPGALVYAAAGSDGRLLAVGGSPGRQRVWQSSAGLAWSPLELPAAAAADQDWHLGLLAASGHTLVAADNLPGQPYVLVNDGTAWYEPSSGGLFGRPLPIATPTSLVDENGHLTMSVQVDDPGTEVGEARTRVALLTSLNGRDWQTTDPDVVSGGTLNQLMLVPDGLLGVGSVTPAATAASGAEGGGTWSAAWAKLSADGGTSWPVALISPASLGRPVTPGAATTASASGAAGYEPGLGPMAAVTAGRIGDSQFVAGQAGPVAVDWYSPDGSTWEAPRPLDPSPQLLVERPLGSCTAGNSAVVVGYVQDEARGSLPAAWGSTDGSSWAPGSFSPLPPQGSSTTVDGCLSTGNGFIAYGGTVRGATGQPVLWTSSDGVNWQQMPSTFSGLGSGGAFGPQAAPLDDIVWGTSTWLGLSGEGDLPTQVWPAPVGGEAGAVPTPAGLWSSMDAGDTWQQTATQVPGFMGALFSQVDVATSEGQRMVVAGEVDGRLHVWLGAPQVTSPGS